MPLCFHCLERPICEDSERCQVGPKIAKCLSGYDLANIEMW